MEEKNCQKLRRWVAQQVRNAIPFGEGPRFLICANDDKFGVCFEHAVKGASIDLIYMPLYAPKANAICERFLGSVRRECLDHILILSETMCDVSSVSIRVFHSSASTSGHGSTNPRPIT